MLQHTSYNVMRENVVMSIKRNDQRTERNYSAATDSCESSMNMSQVPLKDLGLNSIYSIPTNIAL